MIGYVLAKPGKLALGLQMFVNQTKLFHRVILGTDIPSVANDPNTLSCDLLVIKDDFELKATISFIADVKRHNPDAKFLVLANNLDRANAFQEAGIEMVVSEEISFEQLSRAIRQLNPENGITWIDHEPSDTK